MINLIINIKQMIIKENVTVYQCQFCKKKMFRKHSMENHESKCYSNPLNFSACTNCEHCENIEVEYCVDTKDQYGEPDHEYKKTQGFFCKAKNIEMYPFKAVRKNLLEKYPETFEGKIQMPVECNLKKEIDFSEGQMVFF